MEIGATDVGFIGLWAAQEDEREEFSTKGQSVPQETLDI